MKKYHLILLAFILTFSLILGSCGSQQTTAPAQTTAPTTTVKTTAPVQTTTTAPTTTPVSTTSAGPTPVSGGVLHRALASDVGSQFGVPWEMNPFSHGMAMPALESIMYENGDGVMQPLLAESWQIAPDNLSITLNLRKNVKFHDGTDWNAEAAKWNFTHWIDAKIDPVKTWKSVDVIDNYTVRINFSKWENTILTFSLAGWNALIISPTSYDKNGKEWAQYHPIGTGPFEFQSYKADVNLVYKKFNNYWMPGKPYLDGISYDVIPDPMTTSMAFKSGTIHEVSGLPPGAVSADLRDSGYAQVTTDHLVNTVDALFPSSANPNSPFANQKVREALEYAINKDGLVKATGYGFLKTAYQLAPSNNRAYQPDIQPRKFDVAKAKQLLAEAGYANGFSTRLIPNPFVISKDTCVAIQGFLAAVGITASVDFLDYGQFADLVYKSGWDGIVIEKTGLFPNLTKGLQFYYSGAPGTELTPSVKYPDGFRAAYDKALSTREVDVNNVKVVLKMLYDTATVIPYEETPMRAFLNKGVHESDYDLQFDIPPYTLSDGVWMEKSIQK